MKSLRSLIFLFVCVQKSKLTLVCEDPNCWMSRLPLTSEPSAANCTVYTRGEFFNATEVWLFVMNWWIQTSDWWSASVCWSQVVKSCSVRWPESSQLVKGSWPSCRLLPAPLPPRWPSSPLRSALSLRNSPWWRRSLCTRQRCTQTFSSSHSKLGWLPFWLLPWSIVSFVFEAWKSWKENITHNVYPSRV